MRVIAGTARSVPLYEVTASTTRSMTDRVKTSLFSIIDRRLPLARVIDLYAGAGSLGVEALSRGAASCVFVDRDRVCRETIERNLQRTRLADRARVLCDDVASAVSSLAREEHRVDILFFDPPFVYGEEAGRAELERIAAEVSGSLMAPDGLFIYHHERTVTGELANAGLVVTDQRDYGRNVVTFLCPENPEKSA